MKHRDTPKLAYSVGEACHAISCGRSKIYELIGQGKLDTRKIGSRTIITAESLHALVRDGAAG